MLPEDAPLPRPPPMPLIDVLSPLTSTRTSQGTSQAQWTQIISACAPCFPASRLSHRVGCPVPSLLRGIQPISPFILSQLLVRIYISQNSWGSSGPFTVNIPQIVTELLPSTSRCAGDGDAALGGGKTRKFYCRETQMPMKCDVSTCPTLPFIWGRLGVRLCPSHPKYPSRQVLHCPVPRKV